MKLDKSASRSYFALNDKKLGCPDKPLSATVECQNTARILLSHFCSLPTTYENCYAYLDTGSVNRRLSPQHVNNFDLSKLGG